MKKIIFFFVFVLAVGFSTLIFAQEVTKDANTKTEQTQTVDSNKPFNTVCPVSGEEVDPEITYKYDGKTYALCCKSCLKKFKNDPEKYISKLSDDGKSIKKKSE